MRADYLAVLFLLASCEVAGAQKNLSSQALPKINYSNKDLGFRYTPPEEMHDKTERTRAEILERAKSLHANKTLQLLLSMSSGADGTGSDWRGISIESYPREAIAQLGDADADAKMSEWVASGHKARASPRVATVSGQTFTVSVFGWQEGPGKKFAVVWTTVRRGVLLSFAFVANSPQQLKNLTESMKSVQFY
jgi:hypothetical protein